MRKYVQLFEEYSKEVTKGSDETSHTWSQVRDAIQMKIPFVVVTFKDKASYLSALDSEPFSTYDPIKQSAFLSNNGKLAEYPSLFIVIDDDVKFKDKIPQMFEEYKIKSLILGKKGEEYVDYYFDDGSSAPAGNEIVSSITLDDMDNESHYKMGSNYYKFIDFVD